MAAEDIERLPDWHGSVVSAGVALNEQIGAFAAKIFKSSDNACHWRGLGSVFI